MFYTVIRNSKLLTPNSKLQTPNFKLLTFFQPSVDESTGDG